MPDPVTVGALVAATLSSAATAIGKDVVGDAVKGAYQSLKSAIAGWAGDDVAKLEAKPDSTARAEVIAETVDELPPETRAKVEALARALRDAMAKDGQGASVDNRITVIADRGSIAAGRDVNIGAPPKADR